MESKQILILNKTKNKVKLAQLHYFFSGDITNEKGIY